MAPGITDQRDGRAPLRPMSGLSMPSAGPPEPMLGRQPWARAPVEHRGACIGAQCPGPPVREHGWFPPDPGALTLCSLPCLQCQGGACSPGGSTPGGLRHRRVSDRSLSSADLVAHQLGTIVVHRTMVIVLRCGDADPGAHPSPHGIRTREHQNGEAIPEGTRRHGRA